MDAIVKWLLETDAQTLINYINYFFIALAAFGALGLIVGLIRGVYRSVCYEICLTVCILIIIFCCGSITDFLYDFDLNGLGFISLPDGIKTLGGYIEYSVKVAMENQGIVISNPEEYTKVILSISHSIASIIVYIVLFILSIIVVAPILHLIIYNLIFRLLIPKKIRKKHKLRIIGGLLTATEFVVVLSLFLTPFTGIVNSITGKVRDESGNITKKECDNDYYNALYKTLDAYNKSSVAQMFFALSFEKGKSFDVSLMDSITSTKIDEKGSKLELYSEIGNIGSLFISALGTGAIGKDINASLLLVPDFVEEVFEYLANSVLVNTVLSLGFTLIANMPEVNEKVDLSSIDFFNVDWSSVTSALNSSYRALYEGGVIDTLINVKEGENVLDNIYIDSSTAETYKNAFRELGNNELVVTIMPKLLCSFANSSEQETKTLAKKNANEDSKDDSENKGILDSFKLPAEESFYNDIMWGNELSTFVDVFASISDQYNAYYNTRIPLSKYSEVFSGDTVLDFILGKDSVKDFESLDDKYDSNVFISGGTYNDKVVPGVYGILGLKETNEKLGLFDLSIIKKIVDETNTMQNLISSIDIKGMIGQDIDADKIEQSVEEVKSLTDKWTIDDWKEELKGFINTLLPLLDVADVLKDNTNIFGIGENIECTFSSIDDSRVLKTLLPPVLESVIGDALVINGNKVSPNFSNIESWGQEGHYLRELLDSINVLAADDFTSIDWTKIDTITKDQYDNAVLNDGYKGTFDDYYLDNSKAYKILTSIYSTQSIGGKYNNDGTRTNGVFEDILKGVVKEALKGFDSSLDIDNSPEGKLIDKDLTLSDNSVLYSQEGDKKIYVSWVNDSEEYRGEIANLSLLLSDLTNIDDSNAMSSLNNLLSRVNNSYLLRDIVTLILDSKVANSLDEGIAKEFMTRADFDVFHKKELSMTPYKYVTVDGKKTIEFTRDATILTRKDEIEARKGEFESLKSVFDSMDEITDALNSTDPKDSFYSVKKLTANRKLTASLSDDNSLKTTKEKSPLEKLTATLANSKIFNNPQYDSENNRVGTTSFEYLFQYITGGDTINVSDFLINLKDDPSILYKITEENKWNEEITNFNNSLYGIVNNDLLDVISNSNDFLNDINNLLSAGKTPIQDLFMDMHQSIILDNSIGYALDKQFMPNIINNFDVGSYYVDDEIYQRAKDYYENKDKLVLKNTLISFSAKQDIIATVDTDKMGAFWKNEASSLEDLISSILALDFENMSITGAAKIDTSLITGAIEHSLCLNYLDDESHIVASPKLNERSVYELTIINLIDKINTGISSAIGLDTSISSSSLIESRSRYKVEAGILNSIIASFQELNVYVSEGDISLNADNAKNISRIFKNFTKELNDSHVYHYLNVKEREYDKLSIFEQIISKMLVTAKLDESIYNANNPRHSSLNNGKEVIESKIIELTDNDLMESGDPSLKWTATGTEIDKLCTIIDSFTSFKFDSEADELSNYIAKNDDGTYSGILTTVNNSFLLHDLVSTMIKEFICKASIDDVDHEITSTEYKGMLISEGSQIGYYLIDNKDIPFASKVNEWNEELFTMTKIIDDVKRIQNSKNIIEIAASKPFESVLSKLASTKLFESVIDQITVSLMHDYAKVNISNAAFTINASLSNFLYQGSPKASGYMDIKESLDKEYEGKSWANEGKGIDTFLFDLSDFVINYIAYKNGHGFIQYPTWNKEVFGNFESLMTLEANLKYNFAE